MVRRGFHPCWVFALLGIPFFFAGPARAQTMLTLNQGFPASINYSMAQPGIGYTLTLDPGNWNIIGVSSPNDWALLFMAPPTPTSSNLAGNACDFVLVNGRSSPIGGNAGAVYPMFTPWGALQGGVLLHGWPGTPLAPGASDSWFWNPQQIFHFWEVNISTAGNYDILVTGTPGLQYAFFTPGPAGSGWKNRAQCLFTSPVGVPQNRVPLTPGWHCLVAFQDGGPPAVAFSTASIQPSPTAVFSAESVSVPAGPLTLFPNETFQVSRTIRNTGGLSGSTPYSIRLSTNRTIGAADCVILSETTGGIPAGASEVITEVCTVPGHIPPGSYFVGLFLGPGNTACTGFPDVTVVPTGSPPGPFLLAAPQDGAMDMPLKPALSWFPSTDATGYTLQISTARDFSSFVVEETGILGLAWTPPAPLRSATVYYWRVIAANPFGQTPAGGAPWSFSTGECRPQAVSLAVLAPPVQVLPGGTFHVMYIFANTGSVPGTASYSIVLSPDTVITIADNSVLSGISVVLPPGATVSGTVVCRVPASIPADREYVVGVYLSPGNTASSPGAVFVLSPEGPEAAGGCAPSLGGRRDAVSGFLSWLPLLLLAVACRRIRKACTANHLT
ncbi:MAG: hypothetical protein ACYTHM_09245 [Planctomycetota bacterium]|jgi:hypothetical protein